MGLSDNGILYYWVGLYAERLPWHRKFLARYFDKFKITEKEYLDWLSTRILTNQDTKCMDGETISKKLKEFDEWAKNETATFGTNCYEGDCEDFNISFNDLVFYDELRNKIEELLKD